MRGTAVNGDAVYNGAHDNAVGIGVMLEIARALHESNAKARRSVIFVAVTAEEKGLLGSDFFARQTEVQDKKPRGRSRRNLVGAKSNATVHVLTLKTGRNVQLTAFSGGQWSFKGDVPGIRKRGQTPGVIAASQAGRIYGVVSSGSGDGVEIVEWKWKSGEEYEEVGVVDTRQL